MAMTHGPALSEGEMLDRMAQAIACVRTGGPPRGDLQQRRYLLEARQHWRGLRAAGLAPSFR
ncbi:hypothetical protein [Sphingomonas glaciei]|uniref:Uncharacterized protein n=1 Tax=Sphingomonas glaciei TaxID=2938948 RepID=A0ABY5MSC5_9SPHN|nr:hypothetical protein [Sphingomonas glaciei]UUR06839.1 hypothetical protein M1K48_07685 [Sphingomonas glaciei]